MMMEPAASTVTPEEEEGEDEVEAAAEMRMASIHRGFAVAKAKGIPAATRLMKELRQASLQIRRERERRKRRPVARVRMSGRGGRQAAKKNEVRLGKCNERKWSGRRRRGMGKWCKRELRGWGEKKERERWGMMGLEARRGGGTDGRTDGRREGEREEERESANGRGQAGGREGGREKREACRGVQGDAGINHSSHLGVFRLFSSFSSLLLFPAS